MMCDACDQQWCVQAWGFLPTCLRDSWVRVLLLVRLLLFWLGALWVLLTTHGMMVERCNQPGVMVQPIAPL